MGGGVVGPCSGTGSRSAVDVNVDGDDSYSTKVCDSCICEITRCVYLESLVEIPSAVLEKYLINICICSS